MGSGVRGLASPHPSWVPPRPCDRAAEVPSVLPVHVLAVPQTQFTIRVPDIPVVCRAGYVVVVFSFRALLSSTVDTCPASALGCFWTFFLRVCGSRLLKSILSCSPVWGAALVVDLGNGMCLLVLLVTVHLALCSLRFRWPENGEVAQTMLRLLICLNLEIILMSPLFLPVTCSPSGHCAEEFWEPSMTKSSSSSKAQGAATRIRCMRWRISTETCVMLHVRTTTTTTTT